MKLCPAGILFLFAGHACGQTCTPQPTTEFRPPLLGQGVGSDIQVTSAVIFDDDGPGPHPAALYIAGDFGAIGGMMTTGLARWDGASWTAINTGVDEPVALAVFDDDGPGPNLPSLYVSGWIEMRRWDGQQSYPVVSGNPMFYYGPSWSHPAQLLVIDDDGPGPNAGRLYASLEVHVGFPGGTGTYGALYRQDAGAWTQLIGGGLISGAAYFDPGAAMGTPGIYITHRSFVVDSTNPGNSGDWSYLSVLTPGGHTNLLSAIGPERITASAVFDDDGPGPHPAQFYLAGKYALSSSESVIPHIARFDGHTLTTLPYGPDAAPTFIGAIASDPTNNNQPSLFASGSFTAIGGTAARGIARFNGQSWSALGPGVAPSLANLCVDTILAFDDDGAGPHMSRLFAGGTFTQAGYGPYNALAVWDGAYWLGTGNVVSNPVHALLSADLGDGPALYLGGQFVRVGGNPVSGLARWNGTSWDSMGPGFDDHVDALALYNDPSPHLIAAGKFTHVGATSANHIAIWKTDHWEALGSGLPGNISCVATANGTLYAGGSFIGPLGQPHHLAAWDGSTWHPVGRFDNDVDALTQFNGHLIAGGKFTSITQPSGSNLSAAHIASFDGTQWSSLGSGLDNSVATLASFGAGPELYAGGSFTTAGAVSAAAIARWNGATWSAVGSGLSFPGSTPTVSAITNVDEGAGHHALFIGGNFSLAAGVPANRLARWDGSTWTGFPDGVNDNVRAIAALDSLAAPRHLFVGGDFTASGVIPSWYLASWVLCAPAACYVNCDASTTPPIRNANDFNCFLNAYAAGTPYANCDNSTTPPVLNANDFQCFLNAFAAGCN